MTTNQLLHLIDELYVSGTRYIVLTGGEPLLRKDIKTIVDHIVSKEITCSMSTNGLLLEERIDDISNINALNISLDGTEEQHVNNRGPHDYKKIVRAIKLATSKGVPVSIGNVVTKSNMDSISYTARLSRDLSCHCYFHIPYWRNRKKDVAGFEKMTMEETSRVMQEIVKYKEDGYPISYSNKMHAYLRDWPYPGSTLKKDEPKIPGFDIIPCLAGDCFCIIDADSKVYPCASMIGQVEALKATEVGFLKAWDFVPTVRCVACHFFHQNELNLLFALNLEAWMNFFTELPHLLRRKRSAKLANPNTIDKNGI